MKPIYSLLPEDTVLRRLIVAFAFVVILMPVHGFLTASLGSAVGLVDPAKAWKEVIIVLMAIAVVVDSFNNKELLKSYISNTLHRLIFAYIFLHIGYFLVKDVTFGAAFVGLVLNTRFLILFLVGRWLVLRLKKREVFRLIGIGTMLLLSANAVFALLQVTILPADFLANFGYGPDTIPVSFTLDDNPAIRRATGFMRGPNVFGAALVMYGAYVVQQIMLWVRRKPFEARGSDIAKLAIFALPFCVALIVTYSRSAWIAAAVMVVLTIFFSIEKSRYRRQVLAAGSVSILVAFFFVSVVAVNSDLVQTLVFHDDPTTGNSVTSTDTRIQSTQEAITDIQEEPFGSGVGSAGPASHNLDGAPRIAENYYLQIAQEVGVVGVGLFITIIALTTKTLWRARQQMWPQLLLASFIGLGVAALFGHTWADDEVALIWWGLAALFMPQAIR